MEDRYNRKEASRRIYVTNDKNKSILKYIAIKENYEIFTIPDDIGEGIQC